MKEDELKIRFPPLTQFLVSLNSRGHPRAAMFNRNCWL